MPTESSEAVQAPNTLWESRPLSAGFWFFIITFIYLLDMADRSLVAGVMPALKPYFRLSDAKLGMLSSALSLALGILVIPSGLIIDRWSRKGMIGVMVAIWSVGTWFGGRSASFLGLLGSRFLVGAGEAGYNPAGYSLISAWFPARLRGRMIGLFNMVQPLGGMIGISLGGLIAYRHGWRHAFGILALPGVLLAVIILWAPDYPTPVRSEASRPPILRSLKTLMGAPSLRHLYLSQVFISFFISGYGAWATSFFMRSFHLNLKQASQVMIFPLVIAMVGPVLGGWLSDWLLLRRPDGRLQAGLILLVAALPFYLAGFLGVGWGCSLTSVVVLLSVAQILFAAHWGPVVNANLEMVPLSLRGTSLSFQPLFQSFAGIGAAAGVGLLSDHFGLIRALVVTTLAGFLPGLALLLLSRRAHGAREAVRVWDHQPAEG